MRIKLLLKNEKDASNQSGSNVIEMTQNYCLLGRKDCDILIFDCRCSKQHALLYEALDGSLHVKDLESKNGTFLNGEKVTEGVLHVGDQIRVGKTMLVVLDYVPVNTEKASRQQQRSISEHATFDVQEERDTKTSIEDRNVVIHSWPENLKAMPPKLQEKYVHFIDEDGAQTQVAISKLRNHKK